MNSGISGSTMLCPGSHDRGRLHRVKVVGLAVAVFARRALLRAQLLRAELLYAIKRNHNPPAQLLEWL
jgi:hypothetical protein